jgi:hypothetical protein
MLLPSNWIVLYTPDRIFDKGVERQHRLHHLRGVAADPHRAAMGGATRERIGRKIASAMINSPPLPIARRT